MKTLYSLASLIIVTFTLTAAAQKAPKYSYAAQKKWIPAELGQVYLGMPLKDLAAKVDLSAAEPDARFEPLQLTIPFKKGNITGIAVRIHGLSEDEKAALIRTDKVRERTPDGFEYDREVQRLKIDALPAKGVVYSIYVTYQDNFDLRSHARNVFGPGDDRKPDDPYRIYDTEWFKKTPDGLGWIIRAFYKAGDGQSSSLQLLGRVSGSEWDPAK